MSHLICRLEFACAYVNDDAAHSSHVTLKFANARLLVTRRSRFVEEIAVYFGDIFCRKKCGTLQKGGR